ncbi:MAG: hypothetical protein AAGA46_14845 [Cyanobacteria bacterium P01_F01_bin.13]
MEIVSDSVLSEVDDVYLEPYVRNQNLIETVKSFLSLFWPEFEALKSIEN